MPRSGALAGDDERYPKRPAPIGTRRRRAGHLGDGRLPIRENDFERALGCRVRERVVRPHRVPELEAVSDQACGTEPS